MRHLFLPRVHQRELLLGVREAESAADREAESAEGTEGLIAITDVTDWVRRLAEDLRDERLRGERQYGRDRGKAEV